MRPDEHQSEALEFDADDREGGRWAAQHDRLRYQPQVLTQLINAYEYQLKFVVSSPEDLGEIGTILEGIGADRDRVVLMAEGTDAQTIHDRAQWMAEIASAKGSATVRGCISICGGIGGGFKALGGAALFELSC